MNLLQQLACRVCPAVMIAVATGGLSLPGLAQETPSARVYLLQEILDQWKPLPLEQTVSAAERGDLTAQHFLGYYHTEGIGGTTNYVEGRKWYLQAAGSKFPNSLNNLGVIYYRGRGVERDVAKAREYFLQAAESNYAPSQYLLARLIIYGGGKVREPEQTEAFEWLRKAADAGLTDSVALYGWLLMYPPAGGRGDGAKAIEFLLKAHEQGHLDAARWIGDIYLDEKFSGRDPARAMTYYVMGVKKENPASFAAMGWMYFHGLGVERNAAMAFEWTEKAAAKNYAHAWYNLGRFHSGEDLHKKPPGFRPDYEKAYEYYEKAVVGGHTDAAYHLGKIIYQEYIPWKERTDALPYFETAARSGHSMAKSYAADMRMDIAADTRNEILYLEKMVFSGNVGAINRLAGKWRDGHGYPPDAVRTFRHEIVLRLLNASSTASILDQWNGLAPNLIRQPDGTMRRSVSKREREFAPVYQELIQALRQKDAAYFRKTAERYVVGGGLPKDAGEAAIWFRFSALNGDKEAIQKAIEQESALDDEQKSHVQSWVGYLQRFQASLL